MSRAKEGNKSGARGGQGASKAKVSSLYATPVSRALMMEPVDGFTRTRDAHWGDDLRIYANTLGIIFYQPSTKRERLVPWHGVRFAEPSRNQTFRPRNTYNYKPNREAEETEEDDAQTEGPASDSGS